MRWFAILLVAALPLFAQKGKSPAPAVAWTFETPPGFQLLEPAYRFPTQIKQALVQFVQPSPALCRAYQTVFLDQHKFSRWLKGVLLECRSQRLEAIKSGGKVISSDPSMTTDDGGRVYSTAPTRPRKADELEAIQRYLDVLEVWDPGPGR
jgi:hypothetical protein